MMQIQLTLLPLLTLKLAILIPLFGMQNKPWPSKESRLKAQSFFGNT